MTTFHCWNARSSLHGSPILEELEDFKEFYILKPRRIQKLCEYDADISYRKGQLNIVLHAFSRRPDLQLSMLFFATDSNDFIKAVRDSYVQDAWFKDISLHLTDPEGFPITKVSWYSLSETKLLLYLLEDSPRVCPPRVNTLLNTVLYEFHGSPTSEHSGFWKTYRRLRTRLHWPK